MKNYNVHLSQKIKVVSGLRQLVLKVLKATTQQLDNSIQFHSYVKRGLSAPKTQSRNI